MTPGAKWQTYKLGEIFTERNESNHVNKQLLSVSKDGILPHSQTGRKDNSNQDKSKYKLILPGDIGYNTMRMWQGRSAICEYEGIISPAYTVVTPAKNHSSKYFSYLFKTNRMQYLFFQKSQGIVSDTLNCKYKNFAQVSCQVPTLEEQYKIVAVMEEWDNYLDTLREKIELIKSLKHGLEQQLLTGKKRFPDYKEAWENKYLGEMFSERKETNLGTLPLASVTSSQGIIYQSSSGKKDSSNADKTKYKRVKPGDIAYNTMRMWQGRCALSKIEGILSPAYTVIVPDKKINGYYFDILFKTPRLKYLFFQKSQGIVSDTWNCKFKDFSKVCYTFPPRAEQDKIVACLIEFERTIELLMKKQALIKDQKQLLLNKLVTGEIRTPEDMKISKKETSHG